MFKTISNDDYRVLHPRPVYLIVSGGEGKFNVMAASWLTPISEEPPKLGVAISKDSYTSNLIDRFGEFTVNVVDESLLDKVWLAGTRSGRIEDKIKSLALKLHPSSKIKVPGIEEALAIIECRVDKALEIGEVKFYIADMLAIHVKEHYYSDRYGWDLRRARILLHSAGRAFTTPGKLLLASRA